MKKIGFAMLLCLFGNSIFAQVPQIEKEINYLDAYAIYLQQAGTQISDDIVTKYAKDYKNDLFIKYGNDEFDWHDQLVKIKEELLNVIHSVNVSGDYFLSFLVNIDEYDFANNGFPVTIHDYTSIPFYSKDDGFDSSLPGVRIFFKDFPKYNFLPINSDVANKLIKSKKNGKGNIDRSLTLRIHFTVLPMKSDDYNSAIRYNSENEGPLLVGTIKKIDVFNNEIKVGELVKNSAIPYGDEG